ncbi:MAG: GAF domain-containing protein [Anaerolinea sp.]|nr:GAF domain-containing protein [Anaerolinea sp.]
MEIDDSQVRIEALKIAEAQYEASSTIYGSADPVEILSALVSFMGHPFWTVHLGLIEEDSNPPLLNVIAEGDAEGLRAQNRMARLNEYPAFETLAAVEVLNIADVTTDPFLTEHERKNLSARGIGAMLIIPLAVGQRLTGLVAMEYGAPTRFSQTLLRTLRSLADQVAVVFENQALLRRTEASLDEVRSLYDINRAMLGALEPLDVLRILRINLAPDALVIAHVVVERDPTSSAETASFRHIITPAVEQAVDVPIKSFRKAADVFDQRETTSADFFERLDGASAPPSLLTQILEGYPVRAAISMVVRERGKVEDVIAIGFADERPFNVRTRRLFAAIADQITIVLQNQRLLRDAQKNAIQLTRQVRVLQTLNQLSTGLSAFGSEKDLFDFAAQYLMTALNVSHVGIVLFDPDMETGTVVSEHPQQGSTGTRMEVRANPIISLLRQQPDRPVLIQNVEKSDLVTGMARDTLLRLGTHALMVMPIRQYGQIIGSIGFDINEKGRSFQPDMVETAQTMVSQLSVALQNIRLLSDAQRRAEQLQQIATFGQSIQVTLQIDAILNILLSEIRRTIKVDRISVALLDEHTQQLRIAAQYDDDRTYIDLNNGPLISMSGTFVGQVWETGEMLVIQDTMNTTGIRRVQDVSVRSVMIAPIRSRGNLIGTVNVGAFQPYVYNEEDIAIFRQMLNQLAVAIENSLTYARTERVAANEALVNDIAAQLQATTDVEGMMTVAVRELGKALGARRARARLTVQPSEG